jgi:hypothetical protein
MIQGRKIGSKERRQDSLINPQQNQDIATLPRIKSIKLDPSALLARVDARPSGPPGSGLVHDPTLQLVA